MIRILFPSKYWLKVLTCKFCWCVFKLLLFSVSKQNTWQSMVDECCSCIKGSLPIAFWQVSFCIYVLPKTLKNVYSGLCHAYTVLFLTSFFCLPFISLVTDIRQKRGRWHFSAPPSHPISNYILGYIQHSTLHCHFFRSQQLLGLLYSRGACSLSSVFSH